MEEKLNNNIEQITTEASPAPAVAEPQPTPAKEATEPQKTVQSQIKNGVFETIENVQKSSKGRLALLIATLVLSLIFIISGSVVSCNSNKTSSATKYAVSSNNLQHIPG